MMAAQLAATNKRPVLPALIARAGGCSVLSNSSPSTSATRTRGRLMAALLPTSLAGVTGRVLASWGVCSRCMWPRIELLLGSRSAPTVKQHLTCIRMLFDWLVIAQVMPTNPAHSVRGPRHSVTKGVTPVLSSEEATALLTGMDVSTLVGLRDRAIIAVMGRTPSPASGPSSRSPSRITFHKKNVGGCASTRKTAS